MSHHADRVPPVRSILSLVRWILPASLLLAAACSYEDGMTGGAIRLIDRFSDAVVADQPTQIPPVKPVIWEGDGLAGAKALHGVADLKVESGVLKGRTTHAIPIIRIAFPEAAQHKDQIHAVEIRLRVSGGANLGISFSAQEPAGQELDVIIERTKEGEGIVWPLRTPLLHGDSFQTYTLTKATAIFATSLNASDAGNILIRPTDREGATFEIESIRLIFRQEHLSNIPSGIGWQGFGDVYRECLVSRSPEKIQFSLELPPNPRLDLDLGTIEPGPVTFEVRVGSGAQEELLLSKTLTTPQRWEPVSLDLGHLAGGSTQISLVVRADQAGSLGIWGAPVIRSRVEPPSGRPRGVILIVADTLRRDHLELHGYSRKTAPHVSALGSGGALFLDNQSQASWTKVSVSSIMTSLYPRTHGIVDLGDRLPAVANTLAESFQQAGFATWASSSVPFTGQLSNLHQGVEVLYERDSDPEPGAKTARPFVDRLIPWLERNHDVPFFAFLHVFDPHSPFEPREPYNGIWNDLSQRQTFLDTVNVLRKHIRSPHMRADGLPTQKEAEAAGIDIEAFLEWEKGWYDGSIRGFDDELGRVQETLGRLGILDDTLIVFMSDHGEEFLEHGRSFHGNTIYGEMTNVPLILSWPDGVEAGQKITQTVQSIDVMPTLLDLAGIAIPEGIQGRSLVPLIRPGAAAADLKLLASRPIFSERVTIPSETGQDPDSTDSYAILWEGWRLIYNPVRPEGFPEIELYNHQEDPWTLKNVAAEHPDLVARLKARLDEWMVAADQVKLEHGIDPGHLSPKELERLRGLGYIQ